MMDGDKEPVIHNLYGFSHGLTLKEQAMIAIAKCLNNDEIEAVNLPIYLAQEI